MVYATQNALLNGPAETPHADDRPGEGEIVSSATNSHTDVVRPPQRVAATLPRPFWLREQCPLWCTESHSDSDFYDDRVHFLSRPDEPIALSLHEPWYVPAQAASERADGTASPAKAGPVRVDVSAFWHYRHAEPEISLSVPKFDEKSHPDGEMGLRLTVPEARALRDALTQVIVTVQMSSLVALDAPEPGAHEPTFADQKEAVLIDGRDACASLSSGLVWWPGEPPGVLLDVMEIPVNCTAEQAREAASRLRAFADIVDAHAGQVEALQVVG